MDLLSRIQSSVKILPCSETSTPPAVTKGSKKIIVQKDTYPTNLYPPYAMRSITYEGPEMFRI